jgi:lysozyme
LNFIEQLKRDEGCKRVAGGLSDYMDSKGYWTRGYGHLIKGVVREAYDHKPLVISETEADALLRADIAKHDAELYRTWPWLTTHPQVVQDAVRNMAFNLGMTRLKGFVGFQAAMLKGNYIIAVIEMLDSKWHREDVGARAVRLAKQIAARVYQ